MQDEHASGRDAESRWREHERERRSFRVWLAYDGAHVRLTRARPLEMRPPPSAPLGDGGPLNQLSGAWIELRDAAGRAVWRRILHDPFRTHIEGRTDAGGFTNAYRAQLRGILVLLVPDVLEARHLALFSSPLDPAQELAPAREVAAFELPPPAQSSTSTPLERG